MTYGRTLGKALAKFTIDSSRWHELAADKAAWRKTLKDGFPPIDFRPPPPPPPLSPPAPIVRPKSTRRGAASANERMHACLAAEREPLPTDPTDV